MSEHSESSRESAQGSDFLGELAKAVEDEQFFLVYQPEIDLNSNAFVGVEALIRWRHPERGVLSPDAFVPELESSGLITGSRPLGADHGVRAGRGVARQGFSVHRVGQYLGAPIRVVGLRQ